MVAEFFGALAGGASSALSQFMNYKYQKKLMKYQNKLYTNSLVDYFSNHRKSLENADYNPLLNLSGSSAQGFTGSASMPSTDIGSSVMAGLQSAQAIKKARADIENTKADTDIKKYGKVGAQIKNLFKLGKENPQVRKYVEATIFGNGNAGSSAISTKEALSSPQGYKRWFEHEHPTAYKFIKNVKNKDFVGARNTAIDYFSRKTSAHSAKSYYVGNEYYHNGMHYREINPDKYERWYKSKNHKVDYSKPPKKGLY